MKVEYDKKDIKMSPKTKAVSNKKRDFPEGWEYSLKRGSHCLRSPEGVQTKFASKEAAMEFANG